MKMTRRILSFLMLLALMLGSFSVYASGIETAGVPEIAGKYLPSEIAEAISHQNTRSAEYSAVLNDVLQPASMGIEIPNINPERVYQTVDVYTLDASFAEALAAHGIVRTSISYSEYR